MKIRDIYIIDDDPVFVTLLDFFAKKADFTGSPISFPNGNLAYEYFRKKYTLERDYILFLDLNMSFMNGWEFLSKIETFANDSNTYVFIVTSSISREDEARAKNNHYVLDFISKPVTLEMLENIKLKIEVKKSKLESL
jgi:two-component SAPR family response regulator